MLTVNANSLRRAFERNLPSILSGVAVAGVIGTVVLAVKATPKAMSQIQHAKDDIYLPEETLVEGDERLEENHANWNLLKSARACWRCYIPTASAGVATIACIVGANVVGLRRNAALLAAYTLVDTSFRDYKAKVLEHVTAQKAQKIDEELMEEKIRKNPPRTEQIVISGGGDQLCYESLTGRYFKSNAEKIKRAAQDIDARILQSDMYASLNEFWRELGLDPTSIGEELGFTIECRLKVVLSAHISENQDPCLAIGYEKMPVYNYDKL